MGIAELKSGELRLGEAFSDKFICAPRTALAVWHLSSHMTKDPVAEGEGCGNLPPIGLRGASSAYTGGEDDLLSDTRVTIRWLLDTFQSQCQVGSSSPN